MIEFQRLTIPTSISPTPIYVSKHVLNSYQTAGGPDVNMFGFGIIRSDPV